MTMEYVVGITNDNLFGLVAKPFFIHKHKDKGFYPIEAQVGELNISKYENQLSESEMKVFQLSQEYSEKSLFKIFKSKKDKNTKEFTTRLARSKDETDKKIRPFIEKRMVKITDILRKSEIEVYFKDKHRFINRDSRIVLFRDYAETVFNIIKEANETRYYLSISQNNKEIKLLDKPYSILSNEPCRIIIENELYAFEEIDAKKLKPFFNKEFITVPKSFEKKWFESFALPNIKKYKVKPYGFKIEKQQPDRSATLELTEDLKMEAVLELKFHYGERSFSANQGDQTSVILDSTGHNYKFLKIERDSDWELEKVNSLQNKGLKISHLAFFKLDDFRDEQSLYAIIDWLKENQENMQKEGFEIKQNHFKKTYSFSSFKLSAITEEYNDWFDIKARVEVNGHTFPFLNLRKHILNGIREIKLPDGTYGIIPKEWFEKYSDLMKFSKPGKDSLLIKKHHFKLLEENLASADTNYKEKLHDLTSDLQTGKVSIPEKLKHVLRPYQKTGYQWMYLLQKHHFGGCLADDMGLGKTIQTLSLITQTKKEVPTMEIETTHLNKLRQLNLFENETNADKEGQYMEVKTTSLIVMPTSLIHNWENEIQKFTPEFSVYKHTGLNRTNHALEFYKYDIVLTTYGVVRNDYELLNTIQFYYIILDESQHIKNPSSKIYKAVNELNGKHKLVLTGTPIENSLADLWAQLNFLNKGLLGSYNFFRNEFIMPIEKHKDEHKEKKLRMLIEPFILRRTKHQVAKELPEKMEQVIYCDMTEDQNSYYEREKSTIRNSIIEQMEGASENSSIHILDGLSKLRQTANHPVMIDEEYTGESGKFTEITEYLNSLISEGHKVLVFSSYKKHLRLVENHLKSEGMKYSLLTGETQNREKVVETFQKDDSTQVFLIQIKAGGFGLNLTAADYVMIIDPWWNPAVEEQAINRAHRIGQNKKVMVYRFISVDTVEEKIQKLQAKKARLAESFITPNETLRNLSREQIMELFE